MDKLSFKGSREGEIREAKRQNQILNSNIFQYCERLFYSFIVKFVLLVMVFFRSRLRVSSFAADVVAFL